MMAAQQRGDAVDVLVQDERQGGSLTDAQAVFVGPARLLDVDVPVSHGMHDARVVIEAGVTGTWWRIAGPAGRVIGIDSYGASAPAGELFEHFGFSTDNVVRVARELI